MKHDDNFLGYCKATDLDMLKAARDALVGSGFRLAIYGRNPDRQQHAVTPHEKTYFRQNLPRKFSTHFAVYLRKADNYAGQPKEAAIQAVAHATDKWPLKQKLS